MDATETFLLDTSIKGIQLESEDDLKEFELSNESTLVGLRAVAHGNNRSYYNF